MGDATPPRAIIRGVDAQAPVAAAVEDDTPLVVNRLADRRCSPGQLFSPPREGQQPPYLTWWFSPIKLPGGGDCNWQAGVISPIKPARLVQQQLPDNLPEPGTLAVDQDIGTLLQLDRALVDFAPKQRLLENLYSYIGDTALQTEFVVNAQPSIYIYHAPEASIRSILTAAHAVLGAGQELGNVFGNKHSRNRAEKLLSNRLVHLPSSPLW